MLKARKFS